MRLKQFQCLSIIWLILGGEGYMDLHPLKAGVLRMEENSYYDWHVDTNRGVGLNLLLKNWDTSHCLFDGNPNTRNKKQLSKDAIEEHVYMLR